MSKKHQCPSLEPEETDKAQEFLSGIVMSGFETPKKLDWNVVTGECVFILRPMTPAC